MGRVTVLESSLPEPVGSENPEEGRNRITVSEGVQRAPGPGPVENVLLAPYDARIDYRYVILPTEGVCR